MSEADLFPRHEASLRLIHNEHRDLYQPLAEWLEDERSCERTVTWAAEGQEERALQLDSCWTLQWFPDTPVGSYTIYAADLDVLLSAAKQISAPKEIA